MKIFVALKNRIINRLWGGLTLSCIGAEIYSFAVVWIATDRFGSQSGYLVALQAAVILTATLTSGALTSGMTNMKMMLISDFIRFFATLLPFISWQLTHEVPTTLLILVIVIVSFLRPVFDPALQAILPEVSSDRQLLNAVNGLFDVVRRIARIAGPAIAALMFSVMPVYNFFAVNAFTYILSALFILSISRELRAIESSVSVMNDRSGFIQKNIDAIAGGFQALNKNFSLNFHLIAYAFCNGGWYVSLVLGLALKLHLSFPGKSQYFGYVLGIYGIFNVLSNLVFSEITVARPVLAMSVGRLLSGLALLCMAFSNSLPFIMLFAGIAAIGAPVTQIPLATLMQTQFAKEEVVKVFRCRMFYEWLLLLVCLIAAPKLIHLLGLNMVMMLSSLSYLVLGLTGFLITRDPGSEYIHEEQK
ncbi:MFS transporter [Dickeya dadantii]|uniref:Probable transporter n=1 Tax=Dickeya dadantii (strain 3937) TaxID=198628 RepID=E0SFE0_DICD3|nr:MFS transporter [Dickeya dadantii]ADM99992.1 Probable transporter [Dickeya dadantii 3937]MCL6404642.1 MFS transporter [Dickeya dadantii]NPE54345.1 MFS transporter [Dickeya dadantii]NPE66371.1 MFS transporter [Dickeya dadantii]UAY95670.1 MFS transporter [Dickeya dadantii]